MSDKISQYLITPEKTVLQAVQKIDESKGQIVIVLGPNQQLMGIVTDGDVRRYILKGGQMDLPVTEVMNRNPLVVQKATSREQIIKLMREKRLRHFPMVNEKNELVDLITLDSLLNVENRDNPVVIMAGGEGKRLRPLTEDCPKPMLKVGDQPMLEIIIERFSQRGFKNIYLSVNYKAEMIRSYFEDGQRHGVKINYLEEKTAMGTAGSLKLLPEIPTTPLIIMNGDILTNINFDHLVSFHEEHESLATMCVREHSYEIPYGVIDYQPGSLEINQIQEKPVETKFVNAGVYILDPSALQFVPEDSFFDMPSLFSKMIENKQKTSVFPIHEYWRDIGQMDDFQKANSDFDENFKGDS